MPATLPTPSRDLMANYPPNIQDALINLYVQGDYTLAFPVDFTKADAAVLFTVPTGLRVQINRPFWEVTTAWTGGASSAIGISSSNANYNTKGDLLGGASGDVAAGLTAGFKGTIGAKAASQGVIVLVAGDTIRFDRIVSVFTAGVALVHINMQIVPAA